MQILIDGDACNVIELTEKVAKSKTIECHIYCDASRILESDYSEIHIIEKGRDSTDFAILKKCGINDIVITSDSGLAAMVLAKKAYVLNPHGFEYTNENIMGYLNRRHTRKNLMRKTNRNQVRMDQGIAWIPQ